MYEMSIASSQTPIAVKGEYLFLLFVSSELQYTNPTVKEVKQECIPVGCVPPVAVAVCWGRGVSVSVHAGIPLGVGLETTWVWAWRPPRVWAWRPPQVWPGDPPGCGPGDPPGQTPQLPPGCGPGDTPGQTPQLPPWVWAWRPARHAGIPPAMHAGIPPPVDRMTDTCKNITFANFVCGR